MKIEFNEVQNTVSVTPREGDTVTISCESGSWQNTAAKANVKFAVVNEVLSEITKIIQNAQKEI